VRTIVCGGMTGLETQFTHGELTNRRSRRRRAALLASAQSTCAPSQLNSNVRATGGSLGIGTAHLEHRPAVHMLCRGAFIQERLHISSTLFAIPLNPLGFQSEAVLTARYAAELVAAPADQHALTNLIDQGTDANPLVALVALCPVDAPAQLLEESALPALERARAIVSWSAGELAVPFAFIVAGLTDSSFRMLPPSSRRRRRLGFGNTGHDYVAQLTRMHDAAERDEHFAFALSLFREALREEHAEFRIARSFSCLEALAYRLKVRHSGRSRDAVRDLLGIAVGATSRTQAEDGTPIEFDRIELGGRIRDKLFHGVPFDGSSLTREARVAYAWLQTQPQHFRDLLLSDCELEFARWANGASRGLLDESE